MRVEVAEAETDHGEYSIFTYKDSAADDSFGYYLSHRVLIPKPEGYVERERRPRGERGDRGDRRRNDRNQNRGGGRDDRGPKRNNGNNLGDRMPRNIQVEDGNAPQQDYHDPMAEHEPKGFSDELDHMDF